ncbi:diphosphomevalonate decarboxylase [Culicoides brevitarsis]|uniref:diphosphomevalonate decarboxylase n=1 Tax=Culicoides brevitarsis TaxID=469753 RepID=UPI00307C9E4A
MPSVTCIAPVNIAVIKYWGKRDEKLILPLNDSISTTLSTEQLCAKTTITLSKSIRQNRLFLNGKEERFENPRLIVCLNEIKNRARLGGTVSAEILEWNLEIVSENNFPTAAGLASSAAGYACLVTALAALYKIENQDISSIARMGSGSACRSIYGGFVQWKMGVEPSGQDSIAIQVAPEFHWPELRILILVVNDKKKGTSSTIGMTRSVNTSELLKYRAATCVPRRINQMKAAIENKDFSMFAKITMQDSNQFHAVCLDTYPPCIYMNEVSLKIIDFIHNFNDYKKEICAAYTFDAGPNACLYVEEKHLAELSAFIDHVFPHENFNSKNYKRGIEVKEKHDLKHDEKELFIQQDQNLLKFIIHTRVGVGPTVEVLP